MNITKDISPLTEFKRDSARVIAQIKETGVARHVIEFLRRHPDLRCVALA